LGLPSKTSLCGALATIADGERRPVLVSGIFTEGFECSVLYDPGETACSEDVQPSTWVELSAEAAGDATLRHTLEKDGRAYVTFFGTLHGPGAIQPDDLSLPPVLALHKRIKGRRYGHMNWYRTKLEVDRVIRVASVPPSVLPAVALTSARELAVTAPGPVRSLSVPHYPRWLRSIGLSGEVRLVVSVEAGQVRQTDVVSGDRALSELAVQDVGTWQFESKEPSTFSVTFSYQIERRPPGASQQLQVEFDFPDRVIVKVPRDDW